METRDKFVMSVAFSPDNKYVASGGLDGLVNIFDVKVRRFISPSCSHGEEIEPNNSVRNGWTEKHQVLELSFRMQHHF